MVLKLATTYQNVCTELQRILHNFDEYLPRQSVATLLTGIPRPGFLSLAGPLEWSQDSLKFADNNLSSGCV